MAAKTSKRSEHRVKRMVNLISQMPKSEIREAVRRAEQAEAEQRGDGKSQPASQGPPQRTVGEQAAQAAASGAQGGGAPPPTVQPRPGDEHALERARLVEDMQRRGLQPPIGMAPSDSSRLTTDGEQLRQRREAEAARKRRPSKQQLERERKYQERRRAAGLPPSGVGGTPVLPGSGGFVG